MAWVATNANGLEFLFIEKPFRSGYGEYGYWNPIYSSIGGCILVPHGIHQEAHRKRIVLE